VTERPPPRSCPIGAAHVVRDGALFVQFGGGSESPEDSSSEAVFLRSFPCTRSGISRHCFERLRGNAFGEGQHIYLLKPHISRVHRPSHLRCPSALDAEISRATNAPWIFAVSPFYTIQMQLIRGRVFYAQGLSGPAVGHPRQTLPIAEKRYSCRGYGISAACGNVRHAGSSRLRPSI